MECQILACYHEFSRKLKEVIPEKPKFYLKLTRVTVQKVLMNQIFPNNRSSRTYM